MQDKWIGTIGLLNRRRFRTFLEDIGVEYVEVKNWGESMFFAKEISLHQWKLLESYSKQMSN